jgi:leucyl/phenylalanyl-tRNA--protein transferase
VAHLRRATAEPAIGWRFDKSVLLDVLAR